MKGSYKYGSAGYVSVVIYDGLVDLDPIEVSGNSASTDIDLPANLGITDIGQMPHAASRM